MMKTRIKTKEAGRKRELCANEMHDLVVDGHITLFRLQSKSPKQTENQSVFAQKF
ncbi:hypothetical protein PV433_24925 [Paenibacillus sp. GYB004]|jgi:hypothetical protein|uniref:hypothetical protein n=1 Tax=Paenibacillus sp. GYB004 TaxID=2994393 RepID=UPI002F961969